MDTRTVYYRCKQTSHIYNIQELKNFLFNDLRQLYFNYQTISLTANQIGN
jgi:hypothetical protein